MKDEAVREKSGDLDLKGYIFVARRRRCDSPGLLTQVFGTQAVATTPFAPHRGIV